MEKQPIRTERQLIRMDSRVLDEGLNKTGHSSMLVETGWSVREPSDMLSL